MRNLRWYMFWMATQVAKLIDLMSGNAYGLAMLGGCVACACLLVVLRVVCMADWVAWFFAMTTMNIVGIVAHALRIEVVIAPKVMRETGVIFYMLGMMLVLNTTAVMICAMMRLL